VRAGLVAFTLTLAIVTWVEPLTILQALLGMSALLCGLLLLRP
jgi:hypothetical protein